MERSLIPDEVRGLSVWGQDVRWSLLGFALERTGGSSPEKEAVVGGRGAELPSYLDWMEIGLQVMSRLGVCGFSWFVLGRVKGGKGSSRVLFCGTKAMGSMLPGDGAQLFYY